MNGFLVVRRFGRSTDVPVGLYATSDEAWQHVDDQPNAEALAYYLGDFDLADSNCATVVEFRGGVVVAPASAWEDDQGDDEPLMPSRKGRSAEMKASILDACCRRWGAGGGSRMPPGNN